ncbi:MAG: response regulator [Alphaproteobacteria bacterium]|nr:response regulator [Alphaproteobacteria bacterium]
MIRSNRHRGFDFRDVRALVLDDEDYNRVLTRDVMLRFGCADVSEAVNGEEGIAALRQATRAFDLVVVDFRMPVMDGLRFLKEVRIGVPGVSRHMPIAMLTTYSDRFVVATAFNLDVDCFLIKPVSAASMRARLARVLSSDRPIRPPSDYDVIDIDPPPDPGAARARGFEPVAVHDGEIVRPPHAAPMPELARMVALDRVRPGAVLAGNLKTENGQILLRAGDILDAGTLARLRDMAEFDEAVRSVVIA